MDDYAKYEEACEKIREENKMAEWVATMNRYDDPDIDDMAEIWGY